MGGQETGLLPPSMQSLSEPNSAWLMLQKKAGDTLLPLLLLLLLRLLLMILAHRVRLLLKFRPELPLPPPPPPSLPL